MRFDIPENISRVLTCLRAAGFRAVPVGGCVRDLLLGHAPHDWDIATSATPEEMLSVFSGFCAFAMGQSAAKHGTITVMCGGASVEVTTFRLDGPYSDGRRPDSVCFSRKLADDLARRDFTINALCLHEDGGIIDLFGGQQDLEAGVIRAIGAPDRRFGEDALRILRALRFAAALRFSIEPQTADSMARHIDRLATLSAERVRGELEKLLCAPGCTRVLLQYQPIMRAVLPELGPMSEGARRQDAQRRDRYVHTARAVGYAPHESFIRVALLLHDLGEPPCDGEKDCDCAAQSAELADGALRRLKFSNAARAHILFLVRHQALQLHAADRINMKRLLSKHGAAALRDLLAMQRADVMARPGQAQQQLARLDEAERLLQTILSQQPPLKRSQLALSGRELIAAGFAPGPQLGTLLEQLLQRVLEEALPNEPAALLDYAAALWAAKGDLPQACRPEPLNIKHNRL